MTQKSYNELLSSMRLDDRHKLRESLKKLVSQINIVPVKLGKKYRDPVVCWGQVCFHDSKTRTFFIHGKGCHSHEIEDNHMPWHLSAAKKKLVKLLTGKRFVKEMIRTVESVWESDAMVESAQAKLKVLRSEIARKKK